jgi:hypothetical protein
MPNPLSIYSTKREIDFLLAYTVLTKGLTDRPAIHQM